MSRSGVGSHGTAVSDGLDEIQFPLRTSRGELIEVGRDLLARARLRFTAEAPQTSGTTVCHRFSRFHDHLIRALYRHLIHKWEEEGRGSPGSLCVVTLGGYGRRELSLGDPKR